MVQWLPASHDERSRALIMINYKRIVCDMAVFALIATSVRAAPATDAPPCAHKDLERHYDQRQNGTENYRLNVDGVVIAIAPAESLFAAASDIDFSDLIDFEDINDSHKPSLSTSSPPDKPSDNELPPQEAPKEKSAGHKKKGYKLRLANLLLPLLKKYRQHSTHSGQN